MQKALFYEPLDKIPAKFYNPGGLGLRTARHFEDIKTVA